MNRENNPSDNQAFTKTPNEQSYTIPEAATILKVSTFTIRRYIKAGKLQATLIQGKFGSEYRIEDIPPELLGQDQIKPLEQTIDYKILITEIARLNDQVGYWRGKFEQVSRLLEAPKPLPWYKRLFYRR